MIDAITRLECHLSEKRLELDQHGIAILRAAITYLNVGQQINGNEDRYREIQGDSTVETWAPDWYSGPGPELVITIEKYTNDWQRGGYTVRCGDRYETRLDRGEAMDVINRLVYANEVGGPILRTQAEHDAYNAKWGHKHQASRLYQRQLAEPEQNKPKT